MKYLSALFIMLSIAGCVSGKNGSKKTIAHCNELQNAQIPPNAIGLPTRGAKVVSAHWVTDRDDGNHERSYCRVIGSIQSVDAKAPDINFQVNLPAKWNGKALQMGGGGYNGFLVTATGHISFAPSPDPSPLTLGYMTYGSDSGHLGSGIDASFALNEESLVNFGHQHLKKTHDAVMMVAQLYYKKSPAKTYFGGASTGGREALTAMQRWPKDYDGIIAVAPALNFTGVRLNGLRIGRAIYAKDAYPSLKKQNLILDKSIATCDKLDGLEDGIVSNIHECRKLSENLWTELRCKSGRDEGDHCLSDSQLKAAKTVHTDLEIPYELADGIKKHEGYNILEGTDFRAEGGFGSASVLNSPPTIQNGYLFLQGSQWARFFMAKNSKFDAAQFDPTKPGKYKDRIVELSKIVGATNPQIEKFIARKGKLILLHGLSDALISPGPTTAYYEKLVETFGAEKIQSAVQFYLVPGFGHGGGSFTLSWDPLTALDNWVENDKRPETLVGTDINEKSKGRKRPLCPYPSWPKYQGAGKPAEEQSFKCEKVSVNQ